MERDLLTSIRLDLTFKRAFLTSIKNDLKFGRAYIPDIIEAWPDIEVLTFAQVF